jgi:predicted N-acyltransferase
MAQGRIGLAGEPAKMLEILSESLEQIASQEKACLIAFKDFGPEDAKILDALQKRGFHKVENFPNTSMAISFASFDEYLQTLSRKSRKDLKKKFKKVDSTVRIDFETKDSLDGVLEEAYSLYLQTVAKADLDFERVSPEFFKNIALRMPGRTKFFLWRIQNKLVAFSHCLLLDNRLIGYYLGFDYSVAYEHHLYFVKFRDILNWCIQNGIETYEMGISGYEPKKRLKFDFIPLYVYVKHRTKWLNPLFGILCRALKPENFDSVLREAKKKRIQELA